MGSLSLYARNKLLDHLFSNTSYTPVATVYLALCTAEVTEGMTGANIPEVTYTSYNRAAITFGAANLTSRNITQSGSVSFPKSTGGNVTATHFAVLDSQTIGAGNLLGFGALSVSKQIVTNNTPTVASGECVITSGATGGFSNYVVQKMLDFMFRNQTFTQPTPYVGLTTATVSNTSTGATITEVSGTGYARVASTNFSAAAAAALSNDAIINLGTGGAGGWGTITSLATLDSITAGAGNLLFYDNDNVVDQLISEGDPVTIPVGNYTASLT